MWIRLATVALCLAGVTAQAQPADDNMSRLESCIQAARLADAICSKIANDPTQRGDCFAKGRAAQLECLDRVLSEAPGAPAAALSSETARPEPPVEAAPPKAPRSAPLPMRPVEPISPTSRSAARLPTKRQSHRMPLLNRPRRASLLRQPNLPTAAIQSEGSENRNVKHCAGNGVDPQRDNVACRLQPARNRGAQLDIERKERPEYAHRSLPRPAYRTVNSNRWGMGCTTRQRSAG